MLSYVFKNNKNEKKKILINYANDKYKAAQHLQSKTGRKAGFDQVIEYGSDDIDPIFKDEHADIFSYERGDGLWLWKPYLILKTLDICEDGDIVFYCDSGALFFRNARPVFDILKNQDIWISVLPLIEKQFTKSETFKVMNAQGSEYSETPQISGTFAAFKKTEFTFAFVKEWLDYCCDIKAIAPPECKWGDSDEAEYFFAHREDQSILSLLSKKHHIRAYSDPSQYGRLPEKYIRDNCRMEYYGKEDYRPFILHHRTGDGNSSVLFKQWLCAVLPRTIGLKFIGREHLT